MANAEIGTVLTQRVSEEITLLVDKLASELQVEKKWILAEITYISTQRHRVVDKTESPACG